MKDFLEYALLGLVCVAGPYLVIYVPIRVTIIFWSDITRWFKRGVQ